MLTTQQISDRLVDLGQHAHDGSAKAAFASRLDNLLPQSSISTWDWMCTRQKFRGPTGQLVGFNPSLTPYLKGPADCCDIPAVNVIGIKGNTRSGKTVLFEGSALKGWDVGPLYNTLWFMQDERAINDYIDERGEEMLHIHEAVEQKINWADRRNSRTRKMIGRALLLYRAATLASTRGKAAPRIYADEIDAYMKRIRDAIMGLVQNRQREYGNSALAILASHPDAGPDGGIDTIIRDSLVHLWHWLCPYCRNAASPAVEAEVRWAWNVPQLLARHQEMERLALADLLKEEARLVCPQEGCHATFDDKERLELSNGGVWLQPHQRLMPDGNIEGDPEIRAVMGFVIHAFMAPFVKMDQTAADWGMAKLSADLTGNDINLRERTVKDLGETYLGTKDEEKTESWKIVKARLDAPYDIKTVPTGVDFLTAFVDVQGDRFEVRIIGWSRSLESWLVDAYAIKQWPAFGKHGAFDNIDPGNRLTDWDVIEEAVLAARYPMAQAPDLTLGIAKTALNASGTPGTTNNARVWLANLLAGSIAGRADGRSYASWQIQLFQGAASKKAETYGRPRQVMVDDAGKALRVPVFERQPNVHDIKKIIMRRMKIGEPGPGAMHMPFRLSPRYVRELVSERLVNGEWVATGANETFDGWVACEAARAWIQPDRPGLWEQRPEWATPQSFDSIDTQARSPLSMFDRLAALNADV